MTNTSLSLSLGKDACEEEKIRLRKRKIKASRSIGDSMEDVMREVGNKDGSENMATILSKVSLYEA